MSQSIGWTELIIGVAGGLSIFLYGLLILAESLKRLAGSTMKRVLSRLTSNRFKGVLAGAFITGVIQSSSVTTVLLVGFISAGLISMSESVGVIMGANIGSTVTAQIIAFKVTKLAMALIAVGGLWVVFTKKQYYRDVATMTLGIGLIFFGMTMMSDSTYPLRSYDPFIDMMGSMASPMAGILAGALFTAVVQSSAATMGIIIVLSSQGLVSLEAGIALAFGANIGTCVTAALAALGKPAEAVRAAVIHVMFNVIGVLIWVGFIEELVLMADWMTVNMNPTSANLAAENVAREIANAHTLFNVANTVLLIGFARPMAWLATKMVKEKPIKDELRLQSKYLDNLLVSTPSLAIDRARLEIGRMGDRVIEMIRRAADVVLTGSELELDALRDLDEEIDDLYRQITSYLGLVSAQSLSPEDVRDLRLYLNSANILENIGDLIETDYVHTGHQRTRFREEFSDETREMMKALILSVIPSLETAIQSINDKNVKLAKQIRKEKGRLNTRVSELNTHLAAKLAQSSGERARRFGLESEIVEASKRVYSLTRRLAKGVLEHARDGREEN